MKNILLIFILVISTAIGAFGQKRHNSKIAVAKITTTSNGLVKGILYAVTDTTVVLCIGNLSTGKDALRDSLRLSIFPYHEIQKIKVRKRGAIAKGAIIGGVSGLLLGLVTDAGVQVTEQVVSNTLSSVIPYSSSENIPFTPVFTITFGLIGTATGALIGSSSKKFEINGSKANFQRTEYTLMRYCLR